MNRRHVTTAAASAALLAIAGFGITACTPPPLEGVTAYEGATIIVGDGSAPIENATIVVDHAEIMAIGSSTDVEVPAGAARVDLTGKTIMPAIIDTHTHVRQTPEELTQDLKQRAYFGVGATLALGTDSPEIVAMRDQMIPGAARFLSAGLGITAPEPGRSVAPYSQPYNITTIEEGRQAVRDQAALGVDIIKIWVDDRGGQFDKLNPELYGAIIDEANTHSLDVTAHIFALEDAKGLLNAGISSFAHSIRDMDADDEVMEMFTQHPDFVLIPNLSGRGAPTDLTWLQGSLPVDELERMEAGNVDNAEVNERFMIQARNLARMSDAGIKISMGTDGNRPWGAHVEMEDMVISGMTPMDVIVASTGDAAAFLKLDEAGTLMAGKSADFIVLDANPAEDINNTRKISSVFLRGEAVDRTAYP
jgi:imidazolonepropionase-like amidohydrolase